MDKRLLDHERRLQALEHRIAELARQLRAADRERRAMERRIAELEGAWPYRTGEVRDWLEEVA